MARPTGRPIRDELLDHATELIKEVGVNGFSYADLAKRLDIKAPSIHHHFKAKEDLVAAVAAKYRADFSEAVKRVPNTDPLSKVIEYAELFVQTAQTDALCLCGAVSADWSAVGEASRREVSAFFDEQQQWLEQTLSEATEAGQIASSLPLSTLASAILSMLEGSLLVARASGNSLLPIETTTLVTSLLARSPSTPRRTTS